MVKIIEDLFKLETHMFFLGGGFGGGTHRNIAPVPSLAKFDSILDVRKPFSSFAKPSLMMLVRVDRSCLPNHSLNSSLYVEKSLSKALLLLRSRRPQTTCITPFPILEKRHLCILEESQDFLRPSIDR